MFRRLRRNATNLDVAPPVGKNKPASHPLTKVRLAIFAGLACVVVSIVAALSVLLTPSDPGLQVLDASVESDITLQGLRADPFALVSNIVGGKVETGWFCMQDCQVPSASLFVSIANGEVVCSSESSSSCKWYPDSTNCNGLSKPRTTSYRKCTGYTGLHWCNEGKNQLVKGKSLCGHALLAPLVHSISSSISTISQTTKTSASTSTTTVTQPRPTISVYPTTGSTPDGQFIFKVGSKFIPVIRETIEDRGSTLRLSWVRFGVAGMGSIDCSLQVGNGDFSLGSVLRLAKPGKDIPLELKGNSLYFTLPGPGQYYLKLDEDARQYSPTFLIIVDDSANLEPKGKIVQASQNVQDSIDNAPIGSTLVFSPGVYKTGSLRLSRSHLTIHLAPGAIFSSNDGGSNSYFIQITGTNITLTGGGIIDAEQNHQNLVSISDARQIRLKGLFFRNSASWAIHLATSQDVILDGIVTTSYRDVWDPDASTDLTIQNSFGMGIDDLFAVKCRYEGRSSSRITLKNNAGVSAKSALKVGTESVCDFKDILFENNDVIDGERGIVVSYVDGGSMNGITYRNNRLFMTRWPAESRSGTVFEFCKYCSANSFTGRTPTPSKVTNIVVDGLWTNVFYRSICDASSRYPVEITLKNINFQMQSLSRGPAYIFAASAVDNPYCSIKASNIKIGWQGNKYQWRGIADGSWFTSSNVVETNGSLQPVQF